MMAHRRNGQSGGQEAARPLSTTLLRICSIARVRRYLRAYPSVAARTAMLAITLLAFSNAAKANCNPNGIINGVNNIT
jgi:hypothetical protein